jgi:signal transduction histidine kinase
VDSFRGVIRLFSMTNNLLLNWAVMAASLFNTIVLIWLGLTVLLNAERRTWGLWLAAGELLLGGAFFLSHSIILGHGLETFNRSLNFWWRFGWIPVVSIPYVWYVIMLWYSGFWERWSTRLNRRHYTWFVLTSMLAVSIIALLIFANPLPSFIQIARLDLTATPSIGGVPLLVLLYPAYIILCLTLSLDVLLHPAPSGRIMGDLARRRARPWLIGAALLQILVSLLVGGIMFWVVASARSHIFDPRLVFTVAVFDLIIAGLIAIATILLGQAVISYEVFTGKALPRRGLLRFWRRTVLLAAGYAALVSIALTLDLHPIYSVLLSALLITAFYAVLSWRSFEDRQREFDRLRPFISSQQISEQFIDNTPSEVNVRGPFESLCGDILAAKRAALIPHGPLASLVGDALRFPEHDPVEIPAIESILSSPELLCLPLSGTSEGLWRWSLPLWSDRGVTGILLLGSKIDGGLYTQEEMETARSVCERLIDTRASREIARRLIALQRERLTESQVIDCQARRILHDEVLPQLHAAMLELGGDETVSRTAIENLADTHRQISDLLRDLPAATSVPEVAIRGLIGALRRAVNDEFSTAFEQVTWDVSAIVEADLGNLSPLVAEVVFYAAREAIRNAAHHASSGDRLPSFRISAYSDERRWQLHLEDNGGSFDINLPSAGAGSGLSLHSTMMAVIGGELKVVSEQGLFTRVELEFGN